MILPPLVFPDLPLRGVRYDQAFYKTGFWLLGQITPLNEDPRFFMKLTTAFGLQ